ncbi:uncharacterized protein METZ01_LOCUS224127, partial [marine metagenome]
GRAEPIKQPLPGAQLRGQRAGLNE